MISRLLALTFAVGLAFLLFVAGAASIAFDLHFTRPLSHAFEAAQDWYALKKEVEKSDTAAQLDENNDQPVERSKVHWDRQAAYNGYTLITVRSQEVIYLVDMEGHIAHTWKINYKELNSKDVEEGADIIMAKAFPNGDLLVNFGVHGFSPYGAGIAKLDKNSHVLWSFPAKVHHGFSVDAESGKIYLLTHESVNTEQKGLKGLPENITSDVIVILSADGKQLDSIPLFDAFLGTPFEMTLYHPPTDKGISDHFHTNSLMALPASFAEQFPMLKPGQILVSIRNMSMLAVLDPQTKKIVWGQFGPWKYQHEASFLPNGNILLFDNAGRHEGKRTFSRTIEFSPKTSQVVWYYAGDADHPFYTSTHGRVQRLPNGDTLIEEANNGRVFEVTPDKQTVWQYMIPGKRIGDTTPSSIYTSTRYSPAELPFLLEKNP